MLAYENDEKSNELLWMAGFTRFYELGKEGYMRDNHIYNTKVFFVVSWTFHYVMDILLWMAGFTRFYELGKEGYGHQ
jgi:hypothetical protein